MEALKKQKDEEVEVQKEALLKMQTESEETHIQGGRRRKEKALRCFTSLVNSFFFFGGGQHHLKRCLKTSVETQK